MGKSSVYNKYIKRLLDVVISGLVLLAFCWLYAILAILVRTKLGSPVLFSQNRPGKDGKVFKLYKFRTMTNEKDKNGKLLPDEQRLPRFGRLLRSTSLDELPELWNIFKGDMSLVGPRPLLVEYLPYYTEEENHRHDVRPGLTGWAQVNGRNNLTWNQRFELDVYYVRNISLAFDIRIVALTVGKVLKRSDIAVGAESQEGNFAAIRKAEVNLGEKS